MVDTTQHAAPLHVFQGLGLELEYMVVRATSLDVEPAADVALKLVGCNDPAGPPVADAHRGPFGWSNELVCHVLELKNQRPTADYTALAHGLQDEVRHMNRAIAPRGLRLMPGGMHPWMNPAQETTLWPHQNAPIYAAYDRIFDCRSHGWANLQSMHVNLPFAGDEEFARLHAAVRLVLPVLPALAASSPFAGSRAAGILDYRLAVYRDNAPAIPQLAGEVIPDTATSRDQYESEVLQPMYRSIAPHDPEGILQSEWLNARGAIPRFDRNAIEIRLLDVQEHPAADVAIGVFASDLIRSVYEECYASFASQQTFPTRRLVHLLKSCTQHAEQAVIDDEDYLRLFDLPPQAITAREFWWRLTDRLCGGDDLHRSVWQEPLGIIFTHGTLARRLLQTAGLTPARDALHTIYGQLCDCLERGEAYVP